MRVRVSWRGLFVNVGGHHWMLTGSRGEWQNRKRVYLLRDDFRDENEFARWRWPVGVWPFASPSPRHRVRLWWRTGAFS